MRNFLISAICWATICPLQILMGQIQPPAFEWATRIESHWFWPTDLHTDSLGNVWVAGESETSIDLGSTNLLLSGSSMGAVVGLENNGVFLAGLGFTGTGSTRVNMIQKSASAFVVSGNAFWNSTIDFGEYTNSPNEDMIGFIASYDTELGLNWALTTTNEYQNPSSTSVFMSSCATLADGSILAAGNFGGPSIRIGSVTIQNVSNSGQMMLIKSDEQGEVMWAKGYGGVGEETPWDLAVDSDGNIIICGSFKSKDFVLGNTTLSFEEDFQDGFLVKLDELGEPLWAKSVTSSGVNSYWSVTVDKDSNDIVATGSKQDSEGAGMFVQRLSQDGELLWELRGDYQSFADGRDVAVDCEGNAFVCGWAAVGPVVWKISPPGNVLWKKYSSVEITNGWVSFEHVAVATDSSLYLACALDSPFVALDDFTVQMIDTESSGNTTVVAKLAADPPAIRHHLFSDNLILSWPTNQAGFQLEANALSLSPQDWLPVSTQIEEGRNVVTNSLDQTGQVFRLKKDATGP